jgi:hypothetical protein
MAKKLGRTKEGEKPLGRPQKPIGTPKEGGKPLAQPEKPIGTPKERHDFGERK